MNSIQERDMDKKGSTKNIRYNSLIINETKYRTLYNRKFEGRKKWEKPDERIIKAFIPGTINEIFVQRGQKVNPGDDMLILEAMKMYNKVKFQIKGIVKNIHVIEGQCVMKDQVLVELG